jgi:single-strand DNA-binding protein
MQINEITVTGNLTKDPELKYIPSGAAVCNLYIAINRTYKVKEEVKKEVVFINVVVWGKDAEYCGQVLGKGSEVLVMGRLTQRSWEKDGKKNQIIEIRANHVIPIEKRESGEGDNNG